MRDHRVDAYAAAVLAGEIVAGPYVRLACRRHQRDRARAAREPGWYQFDVARADHVLQFVETCLRLPDLLGPDGDPAPFLLQPWQAFIVGSLFGWVDGQGKRRFREGYVETGKGSGKTPLAAAIGLYGLMMDGERAAEIYAAAANQDQASVLFRHAVQIGQCSPEIRDELDFDGGEHIWQIRHPDSLSFFRTFSRESGQKSGSRPHMGLLDELHEHPSHETSVKIRAGAKRRPQPQFLEITNAGFDRTSICWQRHEHARKVVEEALDDAQLFAYVCAMDEGDEPLEDEACWIKTNPNLGITPSVDYLRRQVVNATNIAWERNNVLRLNFCVWTHAQTRFLDVQRWIACEGRLTASERVAARCYAGLDLGMSDDLTAFVRIWVLDDGRVGVVPTFWMPSAALERFPNRPYAEWQRTGSLRIIPDSDVIDYTVVEREVLALCQESRVAELAFDDRFAQQMAQNLTLAGVTAIKSAKGYGLTEALRKLSDLVTTGRLVQDGNPILTWMAANLVVKMRDGLMRPDKDHAAEKIDGQVALVMALDILVRQEAAPVPQYQVWAFGGR